MTTNTNKIVPIQSISLCLESYVMNLKLDKKLENSFKIPDFIQHGDVTTNVALRIAKITKENPLTIVDFMETVESIKFSQILL